MSDEWHKTACILCSVNCGIEVKVEDRRFVRIRGDKDHPTSKGYTCEKALRLDYYQNGRGERLLSPLRRRPDGSFEEIDWDTAIREVADRLAAIEVQLERATAQHEAPKAGEAAPAADKLFGSVTSRDIAEALGAKGVPVDHKKIVLPEPIKTIGYHTVDVKLGNGVVAKVKVVVIAKAQ